MRKLAPGLLAGAVAAVGCLYGTTATASAAPTATPSVATAAALAVTTAARAAAAADVHPVTIVITTDPGPGNNGTSDEQTARTGVEEQFDGAAQYWRTTSEGKVDFRLDGFDDAATWFPGHARASTGRSRTSPSTPTSPRTSGWTWCPVPWPAASGPSPRPTPARAPPTTSSTPPPSARTPVW